MAGLETVNRFEVLSDPEEEVGNLDASYDSVGSIPDTPDIIYVADAYQVGSSVSDADCAAMTVDPEAGVDVAGLDSSVLFEDGNLHPFLI